tara:strand:- start:2418 stop:2810 length:393 start_codon:yes stop_codon:yes gene_type:complete
VDFGGNPQGWYMFNGKRSIIFMVIVSIAMAGGGFFMGSRTGRGDIGDLRDTNRELQRSLEQSQSAVKKIETKLNASREELGDLQKSLDGVESAFDQLGVALSGGIDDFYTIERSIELIEHYLKGAGILNK